MKKHTHHKQYLSPVIGLLLYLILYGNAHAQSSITLTGIVRDSEAPLPSVSVWEKDTNNGTMTDENGRYSLKIKPGGIVTFSFIGYKTQTHIVSGTTLNITLQPDQAILDEVVINAGYYNVKDKERTGSIAKVTAKNIENKASNNILDALQGQAAGVQVIQKTGLAGGGFDIQIRGQNSLRTDGNMPLYVVDGMPLSNENIHDKSLLSASPYLISPLNIINPNNIESIEILKDADATAIYGSRGANGVVLITTKKSAVDGTSFYLNSYTGWGKITKKVPLMKTEQYLEMKKEGYLNDGLTEYRASDHSINGNWDYSKYTDWQDKLIGNTMQFHHLDFGMRGGNQNTNYNFSISQHEQSTVFIGNQKQNNLSVQTGLKHSSKNDKFHLNLSVSYNQSKSNLPGTDFTLTTYSLQPNAPELYNEDGTLNWAESAWTNPLQALEQKYRAQNDLLHSAMMVGYQITNNFEFNLHAGYSKSNINQSQIIPHTYYNPSYGMDSNSSSIMTNKGESISWNLEPQINWHKNWNKHRLSALTGLTFLHQQSERLGIRGRGFSSNSLIYNIKAATTVSILDAYQSQYRYNAIFGRLNYNYGNRYIVNLTGRRDGSSRFGDNNRFANFGSVGAAWIFTEENFLKNNHWLSFGKLRGSYGTAGSDNIGDYQYLNTYSSTGNVYDNASGLKPDRLYNPNFSWEKTTKLEAALELGLLDNRINTSLAWYKNRSSNQLVGIPLPGTTGFSSVNANLDATVENSGLELTLNTVNIRKGELYWTTGFNLSIAKNKLIAFPDLEGSTYANQYAIGQPLSILKLYHFLGVNPQTGLYEFEDINGDGKLTTDDRTTYLNPLPQWYGGLQNSISYKNWELAFSFYFAKQKGKNYRTRLIPGAGQNLTMIVDRWQKPGDIASVQRYTSGSNTQAVQAHNYMTQSDGVFTDASYLRLKNIELAYTLRIPQLPQLQCRIYVRAENFLTLTSYKESDPETQLTGYLPPLKQMTLGTHIKF
ncbi:SusC/RagA family TonB-linked outer membrane protein [Gelidibacter maritimus]|uniref:SusC/RagA family TonB-linked outer membrane protein n=1 Tax=Gelidibacter maritimus TaxID=2761487 RepID=A0A7W2M7C3_9FLAO|nr:SusC/RagA family TonB-linked outer membrane protein [Gelidibacter maritimus]MBA6153846.1 SusC/RagA family TonB-linked outer membrane protein [Gelidibacter maritimus]